MGRKRENYRKENAEMSHKPADSHFIINYQQKNIGNVVGEGHFRAIISIIHSFLYIYFLIQTLTQTVLSECNTKSSV